MFLLFLKPYSYSLKNHSGWMRCKEECFLWRPSEQGVHGVVAKSALTPQVAKLRGFLNNFAFDNNHRVRFISAQSSVRLNDNVLVGDRIIKRCAFHDDAVFHNDGVTNHRALADLDGTEEDGIFNRAFDDATVRDD